MAAAQEAKRNLESSQDGAQPSERVRGEAPTKTAPYRPQHQPLESAGLDHQAAEEKRQAELDEQRREHNVRTGNPAAPSGFKY